MLAGNRTVSWGTTITNNVLGWKAWSTIRTHLPTWLCFPTLVFATTRLVAALFLAVASKRQIAIAPGQFPDYYAHTAHPANPGYWAVITNWDGQWYELIAMEGYQSYDPGSPTGGVQARAWAFPPVFPLTVRLVMGATHLSFPVSATIVNLIAGLVAMVLLYRLLDEAGGAFLAKCGVALTCCFVSAPVLQATYSESIGLALVMAVFVSLRHGRYGIGAALIVALSLTRNITPPMAVVVGLHLIARQRRRRPVDAFEAVKLGLMFLLSITGIFHWSILSSAVGRDEAVVNRTIAKVASGYFSWFIEGYTAVGWVWPLLSAACLAVLVVFARASWSQTWGVELRAWHWSYPMFLTAATSVHTGILRYLLLAPSLGLMVVGAPKEWQAKYRTPMVVVGCSLGLALQWWWISTIFVYRSPGSLGP